VELIYSNEKVTRSCTIAIGAIHPASPDHAPTKKEQNGSRSTLSLMRHTH